MSENNIKPVPPTPTATPRIRTFSQPGFATSLRNRPVVFNPQHIDDFGRKHSIDTSERKKDLRFDEGSLQLTNDPNSIIYRRLSETLGQRVALETQLTEEEEKFKQFEKYGPKLVEFIKDKDGHLKSKFDKVFIT
jgi:hypothetical protein